MLRLPFAFGRRELFKLLLAHRTIHFLRSALKAARACLSTFGSERSARRFLLSSRFGWHVALPILVAGRRILERWLLDFLRVLFGWSGLIGAASLSAFIFAHLGRLRARTVLVRPYVLIETARRDVLPEHVIPIKVRVPAL